MTKSFDLVLYFSFYVGEVGGIAWHHGASEHEILPHQQPGGIAEMVKLFTGIRGTAPDPHHVHVGIDRTLEPGQFAFLAAHREEVRWDHIGSPGLNPHPIDMAGERLAPCVGLAYPLDGPESDVPMKRMKQRRIRCPRQSVKRLVAHAVGPPQFGRYNGVGATSPVCSDTFLIPVGVGQSPRSGGPIMLRLISDAGRPLRRDCGVNPV